MAYFDLFDDNELAGLVQEQENILSPVIPSVETSAVTSENDLINASNDTSNNASYVIKRSVTPKTSISKISPRNSSGGKPPLPINSNEKRSQTPQSVSGTYSIKIKFK
jgi:hypothetical protein